MVWFKKKKVKDFVPPLQEQKEVLGDSMKELLDGRLLADTVLRKNIGFILFLTFLGIVYIANGYATEKLYMKKVRMEKELSELRFESITTASESAFPRRWRGGFRRPGWIWCRVRNRRPKSRGDVGR